MWHIGVDVTVGDSNLERMQVTEPTRLCSRVTRRVVSSNRSSVFTSNPLSPHSPLSPQVISNDAQNDPRARGVPPGHPIIEKFMGIPLYTGEPS